MGAGGVYRKGILELLRLISAVEVRNYNADVETYISATFKRVPAVEGFAEFHASAYLIMDF